MADLVTAPVTGLADWYKDAIIYQTHIKAFFDSNNDGIGDFAGLTAKLDYIKDLGVNTIWLLPFYPSPLRDDGYDIADYTNVNPSYGTMEDFKHFVDEAHKLGLKVITELVINHTSDQHPWFQRARSAPKGSEERSWYVWSDDDKLYSGTRIIFTDTEKSNWTWDPVAEQYFWHRFFSHQPDLNFDHPPVMQAVIDAMYFWLDLGVDGLRLDAIPYLVERDGTSNENIPETHAVIKALRRALDAKFPDRFFLAEANMWPEDVIQYFGEGDECHMAFHFPLMPRMYMAVAREDRHPITDIMSQTPEIRPENQWAIFLRNHDELTLEMVTDKERDYLWETYAADKRMRINVGIRRRLAPLMDNDRRKIELMNSLLLSMPGTPIMYYGDEIGMGDNIYLGDRDGVRTPMQWSPDRNGGYSRSDPAKLFLPAIMDAVYGFQTVNVEAQARNSSSLLSWMKRIIAVRQSRRAFGRGRIEFLYPKNRQVLAYLRIFDEEVVLCVANLSRAAQAVELDMSAYKGFLPLEMIGRSRFPMIGDLPYLLTLSPYGFYWFQLESSDAKTDMPTHAVEMPLVPDYITLVVTTGPETLVHGRNKTFLDRNILPQFLPTQRWYPEKDRKLHEVDTILLGILGETPRHRHILSIVSEKFETGTQNFFLPMGVEWSSFQELPQPLQPRAFAKMRRGPQEGMVVDATGQAEFSAHFIEAIVAGASIAGPAGTLHFTHTSKMPTGGMPADVVPHPIAGEQSNSSVIIPGFGVLKFYRRLTHGMQPEVEIGLHLTEQKRKVNVPAVLGYAEIEFPNGQKSALAVLHEFVDNQGDGWAYTLAYLNRIVDHFVVLDAKETKKGAKESAELHKDYLDFARKLGQRTAEVHLALAGDTTDEAFSPEPITGSDVETWVIEARAQAHETLGRLKDRGGDSQLIRDVLAREAAMEAAIGTLLEGLTVAGIKTRVHGDYHMGQILVAESDVVIVDFEGEPKLSVEERRRKRSPLVDVAGMIRSFDYAAWTALERVMTDYAAKRPIIEKLLFAWRDAATQAFESGYWASYHADGAPTPTPFEAALVKLFTIRKAFYEVDYEIHNRPKWIDIPLSGIAHLLTS
jgi:maltose alpha-D-glucosyltransferase/alpha-amylase